MCFRGMRHADSFDRLALWISQKECVCRNPGNLKKGVCRSNIAIERPRDFGLKNAKA